MRKILVIGDSCLDEFVYCNTTRLAPDFPVPVLQISERVTNPGMAANVFRNIQKKVLDTELITNENWESILKTRYVHHATNHMFIRVDSEAPVIPIDREKIDFDFELIIVSDYNKGFLSREDIEFICHSHPNVFLDTKKILGKWANEANFIKINDYEFQASKPFLTEQLKHKIIHTRGENGCDFRQLNYPVEKVEIKDTSGAGDTFMAALAVRYLDTTNIEESIKFANKAASKVVRFRGVGVV